MKTSPILPAFGTLVPGQGGCFAAVVRGPTVDGVQQIGALIVADQAHHVRTQWGPYGRKIDAASSPVDGQSNTLAMLGDDCPAAKHVRGLTVEGHSDFFLPAIGQVNAIAANAPELVEAKAVVWSSTQGSSYDAIAQVFENGLSYWDYKVNEFLVVPVRVIPLQLLITSTL